MRSPSSKIIRLITVSSHLLFRLDLLHVIRTVHIKKAVYQLNAKIKLLDVWKALNVENYPLKITKQVIKLDKTNIRANTQGRLIEIGKKTLTTKTCVSDAIRLWNSAPNELKQCETIYKFKKANQAYVKTLPL